MIDNWEHFVARAERGDAAQVTGCPACDGWDGLNARDQIEALIRRGGRRGERLAARMRDLDARFRLATTPSPFAPEGAGWWRYRNLD